MAIKLYPPKPPSRRTLARFLEVSVLRHSQFPVAGLSGSQGFYHRLIATTSAPTNHVALAMLYLTKLRVARSALPHECPGDLLFTACLLLAFDMLDDAPYTTESWALLSGYTRQQINSVVRGILHALDYRLAVTPAAFQKYQAHVLRYLAKQATPSPCTRLPGKSQLSLDLKRL